MTLCTIRRICVTSGRLNRWLVVRRLMWRSWRRRHSLFFKETGSLIIWRMGGGWSRRETSSGRGSLSCSKGLRVRWLSGRWWVDWIKEFGQSLFSLDYTKTQIGWWRSDTEQTILKCWSSIDLCYSKFLVAKHQSCWLPSLSDRWQTRWSLMGFSVNTKPLLHQNKKWWVRGFAHRIQYELPWNPRLVSLIQIKYHTISKTKTVKSFK